MPVFIWSDEYETGIPGIDDDHREIFALINTLQKHHAQEADRQDIKPAIDKLLAYIDRHFVREEGLLSSVGYEQLDSHAEGHEHIYKQMKHYADQFESDHENFDLDGFVMFLSNWLQNHILRDDMAYLPAVTRFLGKL